MNYPLLSEYVESIKLAEDNLDKLSYLRPVLNSDGNPIMSSGNFAVVFKMRSEKDSRYYALKCFIKDQEGRDESYRLIADELEFVSSEYLVQVRYMGKELFVDTASGSDTEFPVLLMDWVEGVTLDKWIRQHLHDQYSLLLITYQFCRMASWLMSQPFAHGDLKPDNILVRDDGSLVLVDYDGMYVPAMQGQKARELGSPDYRHPARTADDFNEHIDDFSLATIAMQLCAITHNPSLLGSQQGDTLLLTEADHRDLSKSETHSKLDALLIHSDFEKLYALYHLAHAQQTLGNVSFRVFNIEKPAKILKAIEVEELSTEVTDNDIKNGVRDEFGAIYSLDGKRLLRGADVKEYSIKDGTVVICDMAFWHFWKLENIHIPNTMKLIGIEAFRYCNNLVSINIPISVTSIGDGAFSICKNLRSITIPKFVKHIGERAFHACKALTSINIPDNVTQILSQTFRECHSLKRIELPNSVKSIGDDAFRFCKKMKTINIPNATTHIGDWAFGGCDNLSFIHIPESVTSIGNYAFAGCFKLESIHFSFFTISLSDSTFLGCEKLTSIIIPRGNRVRFVQMLPKELHGKLKEQ